MKMLIPIDCFRANTHSKLYELYSNPVIETCSIVDHTHRINFSDELVIYSGGFMFRLVSFMAVWLFIGPSAHAILIDNDSYTSDTVTGLDWLDIDETFNYSYQDVSTSFGTGQAFEGWRYATANETRALLDSFNLNIEFGVFVDPTIYAGWQEFNGLFSADLGMNVPTWAMVKVDDNSNSARVAEWISNAYFSGVDSGVYYPINARESALGSFLVRTSEVTAPATTWLLGSAMLCLIGIRLRKGK